MFAGTASLPGELLRSLAAIDLGAVRADQRWVLRLMRADGPALVRLLWRLLGREQDVLDAYQDCFCRLLAHANGEPPGRAYVFRTATNIALDMRRRRRVQYEHQEPAARHRTREAAREGGAMSEAELVESLRAAIDGLPERLRDVIVLRDLAEMSYREVSRLLGLTNGTARVYRREAIIALAEALRE